MAGWWAWGSSANQAKAKSQLTPDERSLDCHRIDCFSVDPIALASSVKFFPILNQKCSQGSGGFWSMGNLKGTCFWSHSLIARVATRVSPWDPLPFDFSLRVHIHGRGLADQEAEDHGYSHRFPKGLTLNGATFNASNPDRTKGQHNNQSTTDTEGPQNGIGTPGGEIQGREDWGESPGWSRCRNPFSCSGRSGKGSKQDKPYPDRSVTSQTLSKSWQDWQAPKLDNRPLDRIPIPGSRCLEGSSATFSLVGLKGQAG